ncbi:hypothetical protein DPMN_101099 [Dreissena polymorpha]|uniref:Uncharacterized protein n=1 Tax=Dreissena polymorpha TaxID=45954 RepID=A0A9D4LI46_DREPO|nr:hypothetical protein DPMN_101099 [Dreissena polymorpha]
MLNAEHSGKDHFAAGCPYRPGNQEQTYLSSGVHNSRLILPLEASRDSVQNKG